MTRTHLLVAGALAALALPFSACSSTDSGMTAADQRVWQEARARNGVGALDGQNFEVRLVEPGQTSAGDPDTLEFAGGRFHSTACDPFGFGSGAYTTQTVSGAVEFRAVCTNGQGDRNEWHGTIRGDAIEGGFTWTPKGGAAVERTFRGTRG